MVLPSASCSSLCRVGRLGVQAAHKLKRRLCAKGAGEKGGLITVKISKEGLSRIDEGS